MRNFSFMKKPSNLAILLEQILYRDESFVSHARDSLFIMNKLSKGGVLNDALQQGAVESFSTALFRCEYYIRRAAAIGLGMLCNPQMNSKLHKLYATKVEEFLRSVCSDPNTIISHLQSFSKNVSRNSLTQLLEEVSKEKDYVFKNQQDILKIYLEKHFKSVTMNKIM